LDSESGPAYAIPSIPTVKMISCHNVQRLTRFGCQNVHGRGNLARVTKRRCEGADGAASFFFGDANISMRLGEYKAVAA
jgi:hypothetical protein